MPKYALILVLVLASALPAAPRPTVGLVLSGGGPRGLALLGVLQGLEELRVPVDRVVGCSAGSVVGGMLAQGWPLERIRLEMEKLDFFKLYDDSVPRARLPFRLKDKDFNYLGLNLGYGPGGLRAPRGLSSGRRMRLALRRLAVDAQGIRDFERLPIPFAAAATDLTHTKPAYLDQGDLGEAMVASASVPASFAPMQVSGAAYTDGLIFQNLPIDGAKGKADVLVVVDITTAIPAKTEFSSVLETTYRLLDVVVGDTMARQKALLGPRDVLLMPEVAFLGNFDYHRGKEAIQPGLEAVRRAADRLKPLALSEADYAAWRAARAPLPPAHWRLRSVRAAKPGLAADYALERLRAQPGQALDLDQLEADIEDLMASGKYEDIDYRLEDAREGQADLVVDARPKSWGPDYLYVGFKLVADLEGFSQFETLLGYTQTGFSASDLELRHLLFFGRVNGYDGELYIPAGRSGLFAAPAVVAENRSGLSQVNGRFDVGWVGRPAEFRFGYGVGRWWVGPAGSVPTEVDVGLLRGQLIVDTLDDPYFPSEGAYFKLFAGEFRGNFNAPPAFRSAAGGGNVATHAGPHTLILGGSLSSAWDSDPPALARPSLGGFFNLSAYRPGSLVGRETALVRGLYYYKTKDPMALFGKTTVVGLAYEAAQAYAGSLDLHGEPWRQSFAVVVGAVTPLGPAYLSHARNLEGSGVSYVLLGNPF